MRGLKLKVKLGKLELNNPIVCASGTFGFGEELKGLCDFKSIGAVITKTITLDPRPGNPPPRIYETECGVLNSVGLENPGLEGFIKDKLPKLKKLPVKTIVSVGGFSLQEYRQVVERLNERSEIMAFEINLSCPNVIKGEFNCGVPEQPRLKKIISQDKELTYKFTSDLRKLTSKTLIVKITPEVSDITEIAKAVKNAGADAISLVNTFFGMAINVETKKPYLGNIYGGYSGKAIKPMSLYRVWRVASNVDIPIIAGGGIETAADALEFILAGATAVSLGTVNLVYPGAAGKILSGIRQYLSRHKISDINELKGKANR